MGKYAKRYKCLACRKIHSKKPKDNICTKCGAADNLKEVIARYEFMIGWREKDRGVWSL